MPTPSGSTTSRARQYPGTANPQRVAKLAPCDYYHVNNIQCLSLYLRTRTTAELRVLQRHISAGAIHDVLPGGFTVGQLTAAQTIVGDNLPPDAVLKQFEHTDFQALCF